MGERIAGALMTEMMPKKFRSPVRGGTLTDGTEMVCRGYAQANLAIDYCLSSVTTLSRGIWISFFDTEEAHAVMLAYAGDRGGRAALKVNPTSLNL
jgi:hypothetical protein